MLVPVHEGRSNLCVAVQAPTVRVNKERALAMLPALRRAAAALAAIEGHAVPKAQAPRMSAIGNLAPDRMLGVREVFGIDSALQVPAFSEARRARARGR